MRSALAILLLFSLSQGLWAEESVAPTDSQDLPQWSPEAFTDGDKSKIKAFVDTILPEAAPAELPPQSETKK